MFSALRGRTALPALRLARSVRGAGSDANVAGSDANVFVAPERLSIHWQDGSKSEIHPMWLRERCQSDSSIHSESRQPLVGPHALPNDILLAGARVHRQDHVCVTFQDGHVSTFSLPRLRREFSDFWHTTVQMSKYDSPQKALWKASDFELATFKHTEVLQDEARQLEMVHALLSKGAILVEGAPRKDGEVARFGQTLSSIRSTQWGFIFNVRTEADQGKHDVAYTNMSIDLHVDGPYSDPVPDFQLLHAIEHCTCPDGKSPCDGCSVMNYLVDGAFVAEKLREEHPEDFKLLAEVTVRFENNGGDGSTGLVNFGKIIELEGDLQSSVRAINFSTKSGMYAPPLDASVLDRFFKARRRFSEMLHHENHAVSLQLRPGDILLFDNRRVLHARSAIQPGDGFRWLQGCYVHREGLRAAYARLLRLAKATEHGGGRAPYVSQRPSAPSPKTSALSTRPSVRAFSSSGQAAHDAFDYRRAMEGTGARHEAPRLVPLKDRLQDSVFDLAIVQRLMVGKYNLHWQGEPLMKDAVALDLYSRLMARQRPGTIFDLGTCGGGSALWFSSQARALGLSTTILTCDIQDLRSATSREQMDQAGNIRFLVGDLNDGEGLFKAAAGLGFELPKPWLIAEDCHVDTKTILACFEGRLTTGDYIVFEDTHPLHPDGAYMHAEDPENYATGAFAVEKYRLMEEAMLAAGDEWGVDCSIQDAYGYNGATFINSVFAKC
eukprot:CAMPEP_0117488900 /NCGR_PEP_ID=MMETSP0784-20121206/16753_1 /TAXON_ID=39447 /ORGANISM="" /LENGTH=721 /DNA_ID=CAMNT_0005283601 /DNA_START=87 /DNA_END=2252 /DNA_ORIENTATION=-